MPNNHQNAPNDELISLQALSPTIFIQVLTNKHHQ